MTEVGRFTMWVILLVIAIIGAHFLVLRAAVYLRSSYDPVAADPGTGNAC